MNQALSETEDSIIPDWKVGDLMISDAESDYKGIVLAVNDRLAIINQDGHFHNCISCLQPTTIRSHNTGLDYKLTSPKALQEDFRNGLFTPYFQKPIT